MRYLLDTNAVIDLLNNTTSRIAQRIREQKPDDVVISALVAYELFHGAFKSQRKSKNLALVDALQFAVLQFDKEDARRAGEVRACLGAKGTPIGAYDVLLAGQALARSMILVTHNTREFKRVPGLRIADWQS